TLYTPESNRNFSYTYLSPSINFSWSRNDIASNYILQVSKDKNFKKPLILNEEISAMRISYNLDEGKYYWRVIASGISEESKISSREQTFNVTKIPRQHPPVLLFPLPESVIQRYEVREHGLTFNWESKKELNAIELIISESSDFKKHYTLQNTDRNYILYKADMKPGYYYWKIRGKDSRGNYTDFSKILRFRVIESDEITLLYPAGGKIYTWQESMSNGILLGWKPIGFKADYKLVISKQKSFNKIDLNKKITSSRFKIRNLKAGTYFWKVSLVDISGDDIIASRISKFQLLENIENPVIVYPPDGRNIDLSGKQSIEFQWIKSKDADYYILELYELKTDKKIFAEKTKKNSFEFKALQSLNQGRYNWRITAVKKSDGEESPGETVEGNFIIQLKTIKPPQFITE
ncbi:MAG: hypothetical protein OEZ34_01980, partial [Spirochaetia bacterium]|nr:hypothetical protein [Spirochaetia bacterium]